MKYFTTLTLISLFLLAKATPLPTPDSTHDDVSSPWTRPSDKFGPGYHGWAEEHEDVSSPWTRPSDKFGFVHFPSSLNKLKHEIRTDFSLALDTTPSVQNNTTTSLPRGPSHLINSVLDITASVQRNTKTSPLHGPSYPTNLVQATTPSAQSNTKISYHL
jgi:hypothetical protein